MIIIACLDDNNGMLFNNRRLSMDQVLRKHILQITANRKLYMNNYSYGQFSNEADGNIIVDDNLLNNAQKGDYCFIENYLLSNHINKIEKIIIYRWNRIYPSDMKFDVSLDNNWSIISKYDFKGNSHNKITEEVYARNEKE